jgi:hypothetical protein
LVYRKNHFDRKHAVFSGKRPKLWNTDAWQQFFRSHGTFRVICLTCSSKIIERRDAAVGGQEQVAGMRVREGGAPADGKARKKSRHVLHRDEIQRMAQKMSSK